MIKAKILKSYWLRKKKDLKARVFKTSKTIHSCGRGHYFNVYEVWWDGELVYSITEVTKDAKLRALGLADGINHYHVLGKQIKWPIKETL